MSDTLAPPRRPSILSLIGPALKARAGDLMPLNERLRTSPDIMVFNLGIIRVFVLGNPELIQELLVKNHKSYHKDPGIVFLRHVLGNGLLTSEEQVHLRNRRMIQPAFHKERVEGYARDMIQYATQARDSWQDGDVRDIHEEMMKVTLEIIGKSMFSAEVEGDAKTVAHALDMIFKTMEVLMVPVLGRLLMLLPFGPGARLRKARDGVDKTIYRMITEHTDAESPFNDLLTMLLASRDEDDGKGMDIRQIRDECITLFLAGHETTAVALSWTWLLLSQHPEVEAKLHEELDRVLGDRDPEFADYPKLEYTRWVFSESMRLYPPAYGFGRQAIEANEIGGHKIRKGDLVQVSPMFTQRDPRYFPDPEAFIPERWHPDEVAKRPKFSYFPFGGGVRKCIGEPFAWMEGVLLLATFAQKWQLRHDPTHKAVPDLKVTLRPKYGMRMSIHRRK